MQNISVITGCSGMDGAVLSKQLLDKGHFVIGIDKRRSRPEIDRINLMGVLNNQNFKLLEGDITDSCFITRTIVDYKPNYYYHLASMSHVGHSFQVPEYSIEVTGKAVLYPLEAIRKFSKETRFYFAGTSELFGGLNCPKEGYNEDSIINPRSPYSCAKALGLYLTRVYRMSYDLFASVGILFNHEHTTRPVDFVTRKITHNIALIDSGKQKKMTLGNIDAYRDWGWSPDYTLGQQLILGHSEPDDFVLATGESYSVRDFLTKAFKVWNPNKSWEDYVDFDPRYIRPSEVPYLKGNPAKAESILGWKREYNFDRLVEEMTNHDLALQRSIL